MQASVELETAARAVQHASRRFLVTRRGRAQRRANSTSTAPLLPATEADIAPQQPAAAADLTPPPPAPTAPRTWARAPQRLLACCCDPLVARLVALSSADEPPDGSPEGAPTSADSEPAPPDWFLIDRALTGDAGQLARREHARLQRWVGAWLDDFEAAWLELTADARRSTLARASERIGAKCLAPLPADARARYPADFEAAQRRWADAPRGFVATLADAKPRAAAGELSAHYEEIAARDGEFETWALQWCHLAAVELWYAVVLPRRAVARGDECAVCMDELETSANLSVHASALACEHVQCPDCWQQWTRRDATCPICREPYLYRVEVADAPLPDELRDRLMALTGADPVTGERLAPAMPDRTASALDRLADRALERLSGRSR